MSNRKLLHLKKLEQSFVDAIQTVENNEGKKLQKYKDKIIKEGCFHPEHHIYESSYEDDDGYGQWYTIKTKRCFLCGRDLT